METQTATKSEKAYVKLGFTHLETEELVNAMNLLLANYHVHYQKLRNFHWNVEGPDFFDLHKKFEEQYEEVKLNIDVLAERIRIFGKKPVSTLGEYLELAEIREVGNDLRPYEMVQEVLTDFEDLLSFMTNVLDAANRVGDAATDDMVTGFIRRMEKIHWMLTAWTKEIDKSSEEAGRH